MQAWLNTKTRVNAIWLLGAHLEPRGGDGGVGIVEGGGGRGRWMKIRVRKVGGGGGGRGRFSLHTELCRCNTHSQRLFRMCISIAPVTLGKLHTL